MHLCLRCSGRGGSRWHLVHILLAGGLPVLCMLHLHLQLGCCSLHPLCCSEEMRQQGGKFQLLDKLLVKLHKKGHRVLVFSQVSSSLAQAAQALRLQRALQVIVRSWHTVCHAGWASCLLLLCNSTSVPAGSSPCG